MTGISDDIVKLIGAKNIVRQAGSQCKKDLEATMNFFHMTWQSCNGSKGYNRKQNTSSAHKGQPSNGSAGGGKRWKCDPNFTPQAKSHPKEEWFALSTSLGARLDEEEETTLESIRVVAAVIADIEPEQAQARTAKGVSFELDQRQDQAGNQFGRHAHQQ